MGFLMEKVLCIMQKEKYMMVIGALGNIMVQVTKTGVMASRIRESGRYIYGLVPCT